MLGRQIPFAKRGIAKRNEVAGAAIGFEHAEPWRARLAGRIQAALDEIGSR